MNTENTGHPSNADPATNTGTPCVSTAYPPSLSLFCSGNSGREVLSGEGGLDRPSVPSLESLPLELKAPERQAQPNPLPVPHPARPARRPEGQQV